MGEDAPVTVPSTNPKAQARRHIRAQRQVITAEQRKLGGTTMAAALAEVDLPKRGTTVAAFLSLPTEPDTAPLIQRFRERSCRILLPAVHGRNLDWMILPSEPADFTIGVLGIREVSAESIGHDAAPLLNCSLVLVPCLAVNTDGRRLGQGGGYYDRIIAELPPVARGGPLLIGVCFPGECGINIPVEGHDAALHACLTSAGLHWFVKP